MRPPSSSYPPQPTTKRPAQSDGEERTKRVKTENTDSSKDDFPTEHMDVEPIDGHLHDVTNLSLDVPRPTTESLLQTEPRPESPAPNEVRPQGSFEHLLCHDVGNRIIDFFKPPIDLVASHDDRTLQAAGRVYYRLASTSRALNRRMQCDPIAASIEWLWNLNHIGDQIRGKLDASALPVLIEGISDVRLPDRPDAQEKRTDILFQRLLWCTHEEKFKSLLSALFEQTKGHALDSNHGMFIDPQHLALSALGAIVHRFGDRGITPRLIDQIVALSPSLSERSRAAFWAELAIHDRKNPERLANALNELDKLINGDTELSAFRKFVDEAIRFLKDPQNATDELRAAMIAKLDSNNTLWPSSVKLLKELAFLAEPEEEGVKPLSEEQRTRLQRALVRYMQTLNALHINIDMTKARVAMSAIPRDLLMSAFSELEMDDKLKIVDILVKVDLLKRDEVFYRELQSWLPVIKSALTDNSIPRDRRLRLVNDLLNRMRITSKAGTHEAIELRVLCDLLRQGN